MTYLPWSWESWSIFPQQRKLIGSSAQNSSGVHWCRRRAGSTRFRRRFRRFRRRFWESLVQSQARSGSTRFRSRFWSRFGAEPGQVQQGYEEGSGRSGSTGFRRRFRKRFRRRRFWRMSGKLWCRGRSGSTAFRRRYAECSWRRSGRFRRRLQRRSRRRFWESLVRRRFRRSLFFSFCFSGMCADGIITWMLLEQLCFPDSFLRFVLIMPILTTLLPRCCLLERFVKIKRCGYRGYHRSIICSKAEVVTTGPHNPDSVMLSCNGHFYPPRKPREPCVFFGSALGCWKGNSCNFRHLMVNQTGTRPTKASRDQVKEELRRRGWAGHDMSGRSRLIWSMMSMGDSGWEEKEVA